MIHANCRTRLTADDFTFIIGVLSRSEADQVSLVRLLTDEDTRDAILDHELLARMILESPQRLPISPHLFFYVLCRKVLRDTHVKGRDAADFVASVLEGFMRTPRLEPGEEAGRRSMQYLSDIMQAMNNAGTREAFLLRSHAANYALFISGLFADNVEMRTRQRGAPDLSFYEAVGQMNYRAASEYREAKKFKLQSIYEELASGFREVRLALNDLASRLLHLDSPTASIIAS
jgi:hypothetical protein